MSAFDRIANVAKGKVSKLVGDVERNNPEAVFESAIENRKASLAHHKEVAATLVGQRNQLTSELEGYEGELRQLTTALHGAVEEGDEDTALVLEVRRQEVANVVEDKTAERLRVTEQVEMTQQALKKLRAHTEDLKREKITAVVMGEVAEARIEIHDTISGTSDRASDIALNKVRDNIQSLKRQAHPGYLDEEGNSVRGRAEALGRKAAEQRARAELQKLKDEMAARKADNDEA
jgi:phage shock protein A